MKQWLAPFLVVLVIAVLYFVPGGGGQTSRGRAMIRNLNFYYACVLITAIASVIGSIRFGNDWTDMAAWIVGGLAIAAAIGRFFTASETLTAEKSGERGPLEKAEEKRR